jgi:hypothetical protein
MASLYEIHPNITNYPAAEKTRTSILLARGPELLAIRSFWVSCKVPICLSTIFGEITTQFGEFQRSPVLLVKRKPLSLSLNRYLLKWVEQRWWRSWAVCSLAIVRNTMTGPPISYLTREMTNWSSLDPLGPCCHFMEYGSEFTWACGSVWTKIDEHSANRPISDVLD